MLLFEPKKVSGLPLFERQFIPRLSESFCGGINFRSTSDHEAIN